MTPLYLIVGLALVFTNLLDAGLRRLRRRAYVDIPNPDASKASIIILNWNGRELLQQGLPPVLQAVQYDGGGHEVIVVDNGSQDGSPEFLKENFPQVKIVSLPENLGFGEGNNVGVRSAANDIVLILNNDMVVDKGFIRPLLDGFSEDVFAVSSQIYFQDTDRPREETGKTVARFRLGMIEYGHEEVRASDAERKYFPVFWAGGGASAYDKRKFLALGGFDPLYSPCYVEDTDLSFRAWKRGWKVLFSPDSKVYHKHRASSAKRFSREALETIIARNQFAFLWKNITGIKMLASHILFLPWTCFKLMRDGGVRRVGAFLLALVRLPAVARKKIMEHASPQAKGAVEGASDKFIFEITSERFKYFERFHPRSLSADSRPLDLLMVTAYLPHLGVHAGGGRMFHLIRLLSRKHRITLLTFLENEEERRFLPEVEKHCVRTRAIVRRPCTNKHLFPYEPFDEFYTDEMRREFLYLLEARRYDLIHFEYTQMGKYAPKNASIKKLLTEHEISFAAHYTLFRHAKNPIAKVKRLYDHLQVMNREVEICKRVDKIICVTTKDANEISGYVPREKIAVVNTGVDLSYFMPDDVQEEPRSLIFVGAFLHYPNADGMVYFCNSILPLIKKEVPEVKLYIVGSNPNDEVLRLGVDPNVVVTGFVPDIRPYIAKSSVYIVPLRLGAGIRGKILEAWAMGKPVVATRLACAGLDVTEGENIFVADEPQRFADRVLYLLKNSAERKRLGAKALETVKQYDWEVVAEKLEKVYYDLLR